MLPMKASHLFKCLFADAIEDGAHDGITEKIAVGLHRAQYYIGTRNQTTGFG